MPKKEWEMAMGPANVAQGAVDDILAGIVNQSRAKAVKRQDELEDLEHEAKVSKLKGEIKKGDERDDGHDKGASSGFQVKGSVNLGDINPMEELREQMKERKELRQQAEEAAGRSQALSEDLRERLHASELKVLETGFNAQIQMLTDAIKQNASRGNFNEQIAAARAIAEELGYKRGEDVGTGDLNVQIRLKELEFNNSMALRKFDEESKDRDFQRKLDLQRLEDERSARKDDSARKEKQYEMIAKAPEAFGRAFAQGILESGGEGETISSTPQKRGKVPGFEVGEGESGVADCPTCGTKGAVGIGPTARSAICGNCGQKFPIKRVKLPPEEQPGPPADLEPEEE
jgi:hypothetical protein